VSETFHMTLVQKKIFVDSYQGTAGSNQGIAVESVRCCEGAILV
jgi:hypothetical protein